MDEEILVVDVTSELIGERREEWRAGFDSGMKQGTSRVLQSGALEQIVLELSLQRATTDVAVQRETLLAHWKTEAQWWREEHDKVHAEYCAFVKEIGRSFCK
jgi:hypothetical protein